MRELFVPSANVRTNIIGTIEKYNDRRWYTKRRGAGEGYRVSCACFRTELADKLTKLGYKLVAQSKGRDDRHEVMKYRVYLIICLIWDVRRHW